MQRRPRAVTAKKDLDEFVISDDDSDNDDEHVVKELKEEAFKPKRGNRKSKQTLIVDKKPILDLEEFYVREVGSNSGGGAETPKEVIAAKDLPLPPHLDNLIFYPYTTKTFDPYNPSISSKVDTNNQKIKINPKWVLFSNNIIYRSSLSKDHKDQELKVTKATVKIKVPRVVTTSLTGISAPSFHYITTRRGKVKRVYETVISFTYNYRSKTLDEALDHFIETDTYFQQTFPTGRLDEKYPKEYVPIIDQRSGKINPGKGKLLIMSKSIDYFLENPNSETALNVSCPDFMEEIDPNWFRLICTSSHTSNSDDPAHAINNTFSPEINVYFDSSKLSLLPEKNFKLLQSHFRSMASSSRHIPRVPKPWIRQSTSFTPLEGSTLAWMKDVIEGDPSPEHHSVTYVDTSTIVRFDDTILPGKLVNLKESLVADHVSAHYLETEYKVFGGVITKCLKSSSSPIPASKKLKRSKTVDIESPEEARSKLRNMAIALIQKAPLSSIADLHISDFQRNFLIPSKATLIVSRNESTIRQWESLFDDLNAKQIKLNVVVLTTITSFKNTSWEDVLFADVVLCADKLLVAFSAHLEAMKFRSGSRFGEEFLYGLLPSISSSFFFQRAGMSKADETNKEPPPLLHMKDKAANMEQWFTRKGSVDLQGVYWHRIFFDLIDETSSLFLAASDWKWVLTTESKLHMSSSYCTRHLTAHSQMDSFDFLAFQNKFVRSISPEKKSLNPPTVLSFVSLESSVVDVVGGSMNSNGASSSVTTSTTSSSAKGKGKAAMKASAPASSKSGIQRRIPRPRSRKESASVGPSRDVFNVIADKSDDESVGFVLDDSSGDETAGKILKKGLRGSKRDTVSLACSGTRGSRSVSAAAADESGSVVLDEEADDAMDVDISVANPPSPIVDQELLVEVGADYTEKIAQLVDMGFRDIVKCTVALSRYDGNMERALNYMFGDA